MIELTERSIAHKKSEASERSRPPFLSKYARIPPSSAGGMNGLPSPLGGEG
jgi:hypothetical protein